MPLFFRAKADRVPARAPFLAGVVVLLSWAAIRAESPAPAGSPQAAISAGDIVLLDFSAPWCGPCRSMAPLIGEISSAGWIVRHVDVDREGDLVRRFGVTGVPCYVLLVKGREVGRINGATTRGELENLLAKSREPAGIPGAAAVPIAASVPRTPVPGIPLPSTVAEAPLAIEATVPRESLERLPAAAIATPASVAEARPAAAAVQAAPPLPAAARAALEQRLLAATARLKVDDSQGMSWGTGTVIDCRQGEALILTCGHIFRDSEGKGRIEVDLFGPNGQRGLAGQVIAWDLKRDLALVSIFTDAKIEPVKVGGSQRTTAAGEPVVTVGCNGGKDPSIHYSNVTAVDKYLGPANVQVAGQPVQGRSGGGLFSIDGTLLGVCNAADPTDNEGLFAALPAIHEQLDESGLAFVYRSAYPSGSVTETAAAAVPSMPAEMPAVAFDRRDRAGAVPTASNGLDVAAVGPESRAPAAAPAAAALSPGEQALLEHVRQHEGKAEVICIVRPHDAPQAASEVFVLQGASRDFVDQLAKTHAVNAAHGHKPKTPASDLATLPPANPVR
jgi:thiol-disulfide isomerase/thioredoxin